MKRRGRGFLDAAEQILREKGEPMRGEEIIRIGLQRKLFTTTTEGEDAANRSLIGTLYSDITRGANVRGFVSYGNRMFGLVEWGDGTQPPLTMRQPRPRNVRTPIPAVVAPPPGITLEMLESTRQSMPTDEFRRIWGNVYDRLIAEERAKAITPVNDRYLLERMRPLVQRIQDFLQGRGNESPKSEVVCDWIFICYTLELFREGAALWRYVNKDEVNAWQYERTSKFNAACRARVGL